jgi:hypothetical protein
MGTPRNTCQSSNYLFVSTSTLWPKVIGITSLVLSIPASCSPTVAVPSSSSLKTRLPPGGHVLGLCHKAFTVFLQGMQVCCVLDLAQEGGFQETTIWLKKKLVTNMLKRTMMPNSTVLVFPCILNVAHVHHHTTEYNTEVLLIHTHTRQRKKPKKHRDSDTRITYKSRH